ncbi:MAG: hypothetical protein AB1505_09105 [Candidatus Latescibacterota bacterium]
MRASCGGWPQAWGGPARRRPWCWPARRYQILSDFPLEIHGDSRDSDAITARGTLNGGGDLIRLRTTNGDIEIRRR